VELENRARKLAKEPPRESNYASGALWKFARSVGPAHLGAVTHPGAAAERHVYADI
jgi:dihydroxy-acid dehydratase